MRAIPMELKDANAFVEEHHRHHGKVVRDKFRVGCEKDGKIVGVVIVGRPVSRMLCDGKTLEVVRLCTTGDKNVCSFLYSKAARIAEEMGYRKIITYILDTEQGISLKAAGWTYDCTIKGQSWDRPSRPRTDKHPTCDKQRWYKALGKGVDDE